MAIYVLGNYTDARRVPLREQSFRCFCTFSNPRQKRRQQEMREGLVEDPISGGIVSAMLYQTLFD
nr:hypothetical protein [uncultured Cohaesibacter sp.]